MDKLSIAHLINPIVAPVTSDLFVAQPITFESMRRAQEFAHGSVRVDLLAAVYPEDAEVVPDHFKTTPYLERSVLDVSNFVQKRKLPLLKDLLDRAFDGSDADWVIYTNLDISVMPNFYVAVKRLIEEGNDSLIINRRTISNTWSKLSDLELMYDDPSESHRGYDCFVFPRGWIPTLDVGDICIGVPYIGLALALGLIVHSKSFKLIEDAHLTFHIGNDKFGLNPKFMDYSLFNQHQA